MGPARAIVAFSAICAHKLAYPTRDVSFIRYQPQRSATSDARVIHCCADHSVYDPASGARVLAGPAPQPLAAILLEYDAATDELAALGTVGAEQFDAFFAKYEFKLALDHGQGKARRPVGATRRRARARAVLQADDPVLSPAPADAAIVVADLAQVLRRRRGGEGDLVRRARAARRRRCSAATAPARRRRCRCCSGC